MGLLMNRLEMIAWVSALEALMENKQHDKVLQILRTLLKAANTPEADKTDSESKS